MNNAAIREISRTAMKLRNNYESQNLFDMALGDRVPKKDMILSVINDLQKITFPGYFGSENMAFVSKENFAGYTLAVMAEKLEKQIQLALAFDEVTDDVFEMERLSKQLVVDFISQIPDIQAMIVKDVEAEFDGDPAAKNMEDIIFSYPGIFAIFVYRYAHALYELKVPYIPRIMTEYAHSRTGLDIHPGATIGRYFFIDHATGVVIGETTVIGDHVKIYQGVTLGGLTTRAGQGLKGKRRHPTIGNNVTIYSNASILGGDTIIGDGCIIAGNTFITHSIEPNMRVSAKLNELKISQDPKAVAKPE